MHEVADVGLAFLRDPHEDAGCIHDRKSMKRRTLQLRVDARQVAAANRIRASYEKTLNVRFGRSEVVEMLVRNGWNQVVSEGGLASRRKREGALMKSVRISIRISADLAREIALMQERVYRTQGFRLTKSATIEALIERGLEVMKAEDGDGEASDREPSECTETAGFDEEDHCLGPVG